MFDTTYRQEDNTIIVKCEVIDRLLGCKTHLRRLLWRGTKKKKKDKVFHQNYFNLTGMKQALQFSPENKWSGTSVNSRLHNMGIALLQAVQLVPMRPKLLWTLPL